MIMEVSTLEKKTISKISWHLLPFCVFLYVINVIDRSNIGFAALDMNKALGISAAAFGSLTAMFFVGYFFCEVPSNMFMHRVGARIWMARIMITWGIVTCGMFFVQSFTQVSIVRILLGICEAGFFPGMIYYFTFWFPTKYRAGIIAIFFVACPIAATIGAPFATLVMDNIHWFGYAGWRWVFMLEGLLAVIGGIWTVFYLKNKPGDVKWLNKEEKDWVINKIAAEDALKTETAHFTIGKVFTYGKIWRLAFIYMFIQITTQTYQFWMPTIVKTFSTTFSNTMVGYIMMLPPICGAIGLLFWGKHSDKTGERVVHAAIPMVIMALSLAMIALSSNMTVKIIGLALTGVGNYAFYGPYWAIPTMYLTGEAAAIGVAIINSMSSFGGFSGNLVVGYLKGSTFGTTGVFAFQIFCAAVAFVLTITLKVKKSDLNVSDVDKSTNIKG